MPCSIPLPMGVAPPFWRGKCAPRLVVAVVTLAEAMGTIAPDPPMMSAAEGDGTGNGPA